MLQNILINKADRLNKKVPNSVGTVGQSKESILVA